MLDSPIKEIPCPLPLIYLLLLLTCCDRSMHTLLMVNCAFFENVPHCCKDLPHSSVAFHIEYV